MSSLFIVIDGLGLLHRIIHRAHLGSTARGFIIIIIIIIIIIVIIIIIIIIIIIVIIIIP